MIFSINNFIQNYRNVRLPFLVPLDSINFLVWALRCPAVIPAPTKLDLLFFHEAGQAIRVISNIKCLFNAPQSPMLDTPSHSLAGWERKEKSHVCKVKKNLWTWGILCQEGTWIFRYRKIWKNSSALTHPTNNHVNFFRFFWLCIFGSKHYRKTTAKFAIFEKKNQKNSIFIWYYIYVFCIYICLDDHYLI